MPHLSCQIERLLYWVVGNSIQHIILVVVVLCFSFVFIDLGHLHLLEFGEVDSPLNPHALKLDENNVRLTVDVGHDKVLSIGVEFSYVLQLVYKVKAFASDLTLYQLLLLQLESIGIQEIHLVVSTSSIKEVCV